MLYLHLRNPQPIIVKCIELWCSNCRHDRAFLLEFTAWHGIVITCFECGDAWANGKRMSRPFRRGWRKERVIAAGHRLEMWNLKQHKAREILEESGNEPRKT